MPKPNPKISSLELKVALCVVVGLYLAVRPASQAPVPQPNADRAISISQDPRYASNPAAGLDSKTHDDKRNGEIAYYQPIIEEYASNPTRFNLENQCGVNPEPLRRVAWAYHSRAEDFMRHGKPDEARSDEDTAARLLREIESIYDANRSKPNPNDLHQPGLLFPIGR